MEKTTCQVCGREIKANTGLIAHHGYKRSWGWQTPSCEGARYVPYEVSCERLREVAGMVKRFITSEEEGLAAFLATPPPTITVEERRSSYVSAKEVTYTKPENFDKDRYYSCIPRTYENAYSQKISIYERTIKAAKMDFATMEKRLQNWTAIIFKAS